jgi:hypothetical protein
MRACAMTEAEIAEELGISRPAVKMILHHAMTKIRAHPRLCAQFRDAVREQRRALDAHWMPSIAVTSNATAYGFMRPVPFPKGEATT